MVPHPFSGEEFNGASGIILEVPVAFAAASSAVGADGYGLMADTAEIFQ
jgi:hypothetical protein